MPLLILLIVFSVPYLEFLVFIEVGEKIGGFSALLLTLLTAVLGIYIIRQEGIQVLTGLQQKIQKGESPVPELIHGFFLAVAGFFFLLPGFITDTIAIFLAIPIVRSVLGNLMINSKIVHNSHHSQTTKKDRMTIDGEYEEITKPDNQKISNKKPEDKTDSNNE
jgi:UPF0716 protein FxsA